MKEFKNSVFGVIVAGVGGQGAITYAQLILGAAWKSNYYVLQSEVHGMSQRGGSVNAQVIFSKSPVTAPLMLDGAVDMILGIEPLETLRYLPLLSKDAVVISSDEPVVNMSGYPEIEKVLESLKNVEGSILVDTKSNAKQLSNKHAGHMTLLGLASKYMPIEDDIWYEVIKERFTAKGQDTIDKNIEAFKFGKNIKG